MRQNTATIAAHVLTTAMVGTAAAMIPGSFCVMFVLSLMAIAFGLGTRSGKKSEEETETQTEPPLLLICYLAAGWLGAVGNLVFLFAVGHK